MSSQGIIRSLSGLGRKGSLVEVRRRCSNEFLMGFLVSLGKEWLLLAVVNDDLILNGFSAVRIDDVISARRPLRWRFYEAALRLRGTRAVLSDRGKCDDVAGIISIASERAALFTVYREHARPRVCFIGKVCKRVRGGFLMRLISPSAKWDRRLSLFKDMDITRIDFGGLYEEALALVAMRR